MLRGFKQGVAGVMSLLLGFFAGGKAVGQDRLTLGSHEFQVGDVRLWYRVAGLSSPTPIVFLHGGPGEGSQAFQAVGGPDLEKTQRIVYFDQRGGGRSERPKGAEHYSIDIMVEDIERLREQLGVPKIVLLGHSFGTQLALDYAVKYPVRAEALVLIAATPDLLRSLDLQCERLQREDAEAYARAREGTPEGWMPRCDIRRAYSGEAATAFRIRNLFPDPAIAELIEKLDQADGLGGTGEVSAALFQKGLLRYRFTNADKVTAPVLVIAGGKDFQAALEPQRELASAAPNGKLIVYAERGHFLFAEEPERLARDVTEFLQTLER